MEPNDLNMAETLIKDLETVKKAIHELQFKVKDKDVIEYLRNMSQGIEYDFRNEEEFAHELIAQAEEEQIEYERSRIYEE